jgi:glycosyltransferase involved in cell wall biosynthesis
MNICVCICTYRRRHLLGTLLRAVCAQTTAGEFSISIVVTDNDRAESARAVVAAAAAETRIPILYCVEPQQNIAMARNRAVSNSSGEYIAFIDDDELPPHDWLSTLLRQCLAHQADAVLGPVRPSFEHTPPEWLVKGRFFERPEHPTGHALSWRETRTGNVMLRRALVDGVAEPFARSFGNGGEDQDFFKRLLEGGARLMWCNEAPVYESVPPERCSRGYLLRRALLRGQNEKTLTDWAGICKSLLALPIYTLALPMALVMGQHRFMQVSIRLCDHLGKLLSIIGVRPLGAKYLSGG